MFAFFLLSFILYRLNLSIHSMCTMTTIICNLIENYNLINLQAERKSITDLMLNTRLNYFFVFIFIDVDVFLSRYECVFVFVISASM